MDVLQIAGLLFICIVSNLVGHTIGYIILRRLRNEAI
jgi:hypothetical protein